MNSFIFIETQKRWLDFSRSLSISAKRRKGEGRGGNVVMQYHVLVPLVGNNDFSKSDMLDKWTGFQWFQVPQVKIFRISVLRTRIIGSNLISWIKVQRKDAKIWDRGYNFNKNLKVWNFSWEMISEILPEAEMVPITVCWGLRPGKKSNLKQNI